MTDDIDQTLERAIPFLSSISMVYDASFKETGMAPKSVLWRDEDGQKLRFRILLNILKEETTPFSLNDVGCGYGALLNYVTTDLNLPLEKYYGYDISQNLLEAAAQHTPTPKAEYYQSVRALYEADYSLVSGTFNYCHNVDVESWEEYLDASLRHLWSMSRKGLAVNFLDEKTNQKKDKGLYYTLQERWEGFCKEYLSSNLKVETDYSLKEWTILIWR
ncbi:MAG: class I SAM-dependent methyltransferase [Rhodospirillales bacterium]|nr:class I SAM-dependent methyltransferase [Rhodospirillales bacterium]